MVFSKQSVDAVVMATIWLSCNIKDHTELKRPEQMWKQKMNRKVKPYIKNFTEPFQSYWDRKGFVYSLSSQTLVQKQRWNILPDSRSKYK